jgi:hypothetical protein
VLAALASQALHGAGQTAPPALAPLLDCVRSCVPPVDTPRPLGTEVERLATAFSRRVQPQDGPAGG